MAKLSAYSGPIGAKMDYAIYAAERAGYHVAIVVSHDEDQTSGDGKTHIIVTRTNKEIRSTAVYGAVDFLARFNPEGKF